MKGQMYGNKECHQRHVGEKEGGTGLVLGRTLVPKPSLKKGRGSQSLFWSRQGQENGWHCEEGEIVTQH